MRIKHAFLFLTFFSLAFSGIAQDKARMIDDLLDSLKRTRGYQFNGSILLAEKGTTLYNKAIGYASFEKQEPLKENSIYDLASVSKQFTAMAIMILKEQGKLNYDDDVQKYLDGFPVKGITVRHLLNHTGGMPDYLVRLLIFGSKHKMDNNEVLKYMNKKLRKGSRQLKFQPGEKWEYSNTGYALLVVIAEKASGQKFQDFMKQYVLQPAGMNDSYFKPEYNQIPNLALSYNYKSPTEHTLQKEKEWNQLMGDGGFFSTTGDLYKWDQVLYTDKLVSKAAIEEAFTPAKLNNGKTVSQDGEEKAAKEPDPKKKGRYFAPDYGFGWMIAKNQKGEKIVSHTGSWLKYRTLIVRNIDAHKVVVVLCSSSRDNDARAVFNGVRDILNK